MNNNEKSHQERKTRSDCIIAQKRMKEIVQKKMKNNEVLTINECEKWMDIVADALMTWGKNIKVYINLPTINIPFNSVHTFALYFMDWGNPVIIKYKNINYKFEIKKLWELLYKYMLEIFPYCADEALHISKEAEEREQWSSYAFSAKKKLGYESYSES